MPGWLAFLKSGLHFTLMFERQRKILLYLRTIPRIGFINVLYIIWYRFTLITGLRRIIFKKRSIISEEDYFISPIGAIEYPLQWKPTLINFADKILIGYVRYYGFHWKGIGDPPDWFLNPFNGKHYPSKDKHWTKLPDFHPDAGDIKNIWEASRFEWVVTLARAYRITGEERYIHKLNQWTKDWVRRNPVNSGPNWKCGQEASVRVFNLLTASIILEPTHTLVDLIAEHLKRIQLNIRYALFQDNNHGTSEAAGLFIGGSWLMVKNGQQDRTATRFASLGRKFLENRVKKLVASDGSFSQHSVNYHRLLLDTISLSEYWRVKSGQRPFSNSFYERANAAVNWLYQLTDHDSGCAPNLGANDGSMLLHYHNMDYSDMRPSLQFASMVFHGQRLYASGPWDEPLLWTGLNYKVVKVKEVCKESISFNSGYVVFQNNFSWALMRFPYFKFRPSHNDVFHFDLWMNGVNILPDSGTYSYNKDKNSVVPDLRSVHCHNTLSFNGGEQMPRLSRFLMANWIKPKYISKIHQIDDNSWFWEGSYHDCHGNFHNRKVAYKSNYWQIIDKFKGKAPEVSIGYNLNSSDYKIDSTTKTILLSWGTMFITGADKIEVVKHMVSNYYMHTTAINRVVIKSKNNSEIRTELRLS